MRRPLTSNRSTNIQGFTLVEMAFAMVVMALLIAGAIPLYTVYMEQKIITTTKDNQAAVYEALIQYKNKFAKYPCPASLTKPITDDAYGMSETCPVTGVAVGACVDGICAEQGPATIDVGGVVQTTRVLRGAVPFKTLALTEDQAYDGYGRRLSFIVTERLTDQDLFDENHGGIQLIDANDVALTNSAPGAGGAHFLIISGGSHAEGYYNHSGALVGTCDVLRLEGQNCDQTSSAVYRISSRNAAGNNQDFDDFVVYNALREPVLWNYEDAAPNDIGDRTAGNVGIGMEPETDRKLSVDGNIKVRGPDTMDTSGLYCEQTTGECFDPDELGTLNPCPASAPYMVGFDSGHKRCIPVPTIKCPPGEVVTGFDSAGIRICDPLVIPPKNCAALSVPICSTNQTLPATPHLGTSSVSYNSRIETYACNDGVWSNISASGTCACTPTTTSWIVSSQTCAAVCGPATIGTVYEQTVTTCAPSYAVSTNYSCTNCAVPLPCPSTTRTICSGTGVDFVHTLPAAAHNSTNTSPIVGHSRRESFRCTNGNWGATPYSSSGFCLPPASCPTTTKTVCGVTKTLTSAAHNAIQTLTEGYNRAEQWRCNNGTWQNTGNSGNCAAPANCSATTVTLCSASVSLAAGVHTTTQTPSGGNGAQYTCNNGTWNKTVNETCPVTYTCNWKTVGGPGALVSSRGTGDGDSCTYAELGTNTYCTKPSSPKYREYNCQCVCVAN